MSYVDGLVLPVPKQNLPAYRRMAKKAGAIQQSVKLKPGETVVFSWIVFKSRAHRDLVNAKVMKDSRLAHMDPKALPFDAKRMIYGGFSVAVDL
jgi:uncharacterized protein YbaA (DUF1428 family)